MNKITKNDAMELWNTFFGDSEFAFDCFGGLMYKNGWGNKPYNFRDMRTGKIYKLNWTVDHIRPKSGFKDPDDAFFLGNYEPMNRTNNEAKSYKLPHFIINGIQYKIVKDGHGGYGIKDANGSRIDQKGRLGIYYDKKDDKWFLE